MAHEKTDPVAAKLLPQIKEGLTLLNTMAPGPMGGPPDSFFGMIEAMLDEQGIDPEEFLEELEALGESRRSSTLNPGSASPTKEREDALNRNKDEQELCLRPANDYPETTNWTPIV